MSTEEQELFEQATAPQTAEMEPTPEPEQVEEAEPVVEAKAEPADDAEPDAEPVAEPEQHDEDADAEAEQQKGGVPPHRLRETADRARKAEAELEETRKATLALQQQLADLQSRFTQSQQPTPKVEEPEDFFVDPEKRLERIKAEVRQEMRQGFVDTSLRMAEITYGDEYKEAYQALQQSGDAQAARAVLDAPDPGRTLVEMYRRQRLLTETGGDLSGYREKLQSELLSDPDFLKKATEAARATAQTKTASGAPHLNIPNSVNSGTRAADSRPAPTQALDDGALFDKYS